MMNKTKTLKNKSKESLLVRVNGVMKEIKAGETFETPKYKELLRLYRSKFEIVEKAEVKETKAEEPKKTTAKTKKS